MKNQFALLFLLLFAAILTPVIALAQGFPELHEIFRAPTGSKLSSVLLITLGAVMYMLVMYKMKKWRAPQTMADASIWFQQNWVNLLTYVGILALVYFYSSQTTFSVGSALMFGAMYNLAIDFVQDWFVKRILRK